MKRNAIARLESGVRNLDEILHGGLPKGSVSIVAGPPGSGKTILAQQICFRNASASSRVLYFTTLSEPPAKTLRYLGQFDYFDEKRMESDIEFIDLGGVLRTSGLEETQTTIMEHVKRVQPAIVVIDSFKVFDDLTGSREELRRFGYEIAVRLMAWETTAFLLGEYGYDDLATNPLFSIIDGLMTLTQRDSSGEQQRFLQIHKMRGTAHSTDEHAFVINARGIEVYAPRVTIQRKPGQEQELETTRRRTAISRLDELLGEGIPLGSSLLVAGVAGTGKTVLLLEFIYRGALAGEKGIIFSFEETAERLRATARGLGWEFDREMDRGMIEIVFIAQPEILVEGHLVMMQERINALNAARVAVDSISVFLHKIKDPQLSREKTFQLASIVQNVRAIAFFATDIPYGSNQISRLGVEETVVDGVILLTSKEEGFDRQRYIEIYKLRNTAHLKGRHNLAIEKGGIVIFPRYLKEAPAEEFPRSVDISKRLSSGIPGLDELLGGGLLKRSMTLLSGSAGTGKTIFAIQFLLEGAKDGERGVYITLEEGPEQILAGAAALGLPLEQAIEKGLIEIVYLSADHIRAAQFLTVLTDKVSQSKADRLVLDGASHVVVGHSPDMDLKQLLYKLAMGFKQLGVTTLFTVESKSLLSTDTVTDYDFSPIADNLIMLRYVARGQSYEPSLTVIKTRGTAHDRGTHVFRIDKGGARVEPKKRA
jgi:circadian clock protein KaiC